MTATLASISETLHAAKARAAGGDEVRTELRALKEVLDALPPAPEPAPATLAKCELLRAEWVIPHGFFGALTDPDRQGSLASTEGKLFGLKMAQTLDRIASDWREQLALSDAALELERTDADRLELLAETLERLHALLTGIASLGHPPAGERT